MTLKRSIRRSLDRAARAGGLVGLLERRMGAGLTVLTYHRVLPLERCAAYPFPALAMPVDAFRDQVRELASRFEVLPVGTALLRLAEEPRRHRPLVAITFDDGYADNHDVAAPILEEHGLRATFFPTAGFVASGGLMWFDRAAAAFARADARRRSRVRERALAEVAGRAVAERAVAGPRPRDDPGAWIELLKSVARGPRTRLIEELEGPFGPRIDHRAFAPMSSEGVAELHRRGHEIGSHSVRHEILPPLSDAQLAAELSRSRAQLEGWTGTPVRGLCYPNGDHDERVVQASRGAGYSYACTTRPGLNRPGCDPMRLRRIDLTPRRVCRSEGRHDPDAFRAEICGLHEALRRPASPVPG